MDLNLVTPLILTFNEAENIERTLSALNWAAQIVVVDSGSTDATAKLAADFDNVTLMTRQFDNHTAQWNFGLEQAASPWVLTLDADYFCPDALTDELRNLDPAHDAYRAVFRYCIEGRPLRGSLYPPRVVLFRAAQFRYRPDGHTQLLHVTGSVGELKTEFLHDDRKPLQRWLVAQNKYADLEVAKLHKAEPGSLDWKDKLRRQIIWMPVLTAVYCLVYKRLILDGWPGVYYTLQRVYSELLLSMKLLDWKLRGRHSVEEGGVDTAQTSAVERDANEVEAVSKSHD